MDTQKQKLLDSLDNRFAYHPPKPGQPELYQRLRSAAHDLAKLVAILCPESREQSLALTALEESVFWANAAVARHGEAVLGAPVPDASFNYGPTSQT